MNLRKLVKYVYIFFTVFSILTIMVTNTGIMNIMPALVLMWFSYFIYKIGYGSDKTVIKTSKQKSKFSIILEKILEKRWIILILACIFSISISYFYTGNTPTSVFKSIINGDSLYFKYQEYFKNNSISSFSFAKIPYIIMNSALNLIFIASVVSIIIRKKELKTNDIIYLFLITIFFIYFGLSRGTNFEMFEAGCAYLYSIFIRFNTIERKSINKKSLVFLLVIAIIGFNVFLNTYSIRGSTGEYITSEIHYDSTKIIPTIMPNIAHSISKLTGYFGFGFFYTSAYFTKLITRSSTDLLCFFIPGGYKIFENTTIIDEMDKVIDTSVNWKADIIWLIGSLGIVGFIIVFFILGKLSKVFSKKAIAYDDYVYHIANYYVFLQMFSFPIGNFIRISSANTLVVLLVFMLIFFNVIKKHNN